MAFYKHCGDVVTWSVIYCCVGALILCISMFIPRWRLDEYGTSDMEKIWIFTGFDKKSYGLLHVKGSFSQSWNTMTTQTCEFRNIGQISNIGQTVWNVVTGGDPDDCKKSENCSSGFLTHMDVRCRMYEKLWTISSVTVAFTFLGVTLCAIACLAFALSNRRKTGGIVFGLFLFSGLISLSMNLAWAFVSDSAFHNLRETAWFPYPCLAIGWFLHLFGSITIIVASATFGFLVIEDACNYDETQEKIDKRNKKMQRLKANQAQAQALQNPPQQLWQQQQQQQPPLMAALPPQQALNFPPAPGYGAQRIDVHIGTAPVQRGQDFGLQQMGCQQMQSHMPAPVAYGHSSNPMGQPPKGKHDFGLQPRWKE